MLSPPGKRRCHKQEIICHQFSVLCKLSNPGQHARAASHLEKERLGEGEGMVSWVWSFSHLATKGKILGWGPSRGVDRFQP